MTTEEIKALVEETIAETFGKISDFDHTAINLDKQDGMTDEEYEASLKQVFLMALDYRDVTTTNSDGETEINGQPTTGNLDATGMIQVYGIDRLKELSDSQIAIINQKFNEYTAKHTANMAEIEEAKTQSINAIDTSKENALDEITQKHTELANDISASITQIHQDAETASSMATQATNARDDINQTIVQFGADYESKVNELELQSTDIQQAITDTGDSVKQAIIDEGTAQTNNAKAQADIATAKATEASESASSASQSASNASSSEQSALDSANIATEKANAAAISASNASTSETNARTYKENAEQAKTGAESARDEAEEFKNQINPDSFAQKVHTHDDRYYTESETDGKFCAKTEIDNNVKYRLPPGSFIWFTGTTIPTGYLVCNGQAVSRTSYPALFAAIGTKYGSGDGSTTFNVPNMSDGNGRFVRATTNTGNVGTKQDDAIRNIYGKLGIHDWYAEIGSGSFFTIEDERHSNGRQDLTSSHNGFQNWYFDASRQVPTDSEVRPANISFLPLISY